MSDLFMGTTHGCVIRPGYRTSVVAAQADLFPLTTQGIAVKNPMRPHRSQYIFLQYIYQLWILNRSRWQKIPRKGFGSKRDITPRAFASARSDWLMLSGSYRGMMESFCACSMGICRLVLTMHLWYEQAEALFTWPAQSR